MTERLHSLFVGGIIAVGSCLACSSYSALTDGIEFQYKADLKMTRVDNLFLSSSTPRDDLFLVFSPGIEMTAEEEGAASYSIGYTHRFTVYQDYSGLNDNFPEINAKVSYDSGLTLLNGHVGYREWASNSFEIVEEENLIDWSYLTAGGDFRYELTDLTAIRAGLNYTDRDYDTKDYTDQVVFSVPVEFFYRIRPKMEVNAGVRGRDVENSSGTSLAYDFTDMFYYGGLLGEFFSPKLFADLKVGYQTREYNQNKRDESTPSYDISLIYTASAKAAAYLTLSKDFKSSANGGLSYTATSFTLGGRFSLTESIDLNGALVVGENSYELNPREEDITIINLGTSYRPNDYFSLNANYSYTNLDGNSDIWARDYDKNEINVSASVRY